MKFAGKNGDSTKDNGKIFVPKETPSSDPAKADTRENLNTTFGAPKE